MGTGNTPQQQDRSQALIACDVIHPGPLDRLDATLDRSAPPHAPGDAAPPLAHWLYFLPGEPLSRLGRDGHARRGGFLPADETLPRRMWAGSRVRFHGPLRVGAAVTRRSQIVSVERKTGRSGVLMFVTARNEIRDEAGLLLIDDEHDIVYRAANAAPGVAARPADPEPPARLRRLVVPDAVMLFRYSALTFNGHRIHYDRDHACRTEGYRGLVVHGPLIATLLADLAWRENRDRRMTSFSFRAFAPAFDGELLTLEAQEADAEGRMELRASNHYGGIVMRAQSVFG